MKEKRITPQYGRIYRLWIDEPVNMSSEGIYAGFNGEEHIFLRSDPFCTVFEEPLLSIFFHGARKCVSVAFYENDFRERIRVEPSKYFVPFNERVLAEKILKAGGLIK